MIDEESELGLVRLPVRRAMEGEGKKDDIGGTGQRRLAEERAGEEGKREAELEEGGEAGQKQGLREAGGGDVAGSVV